MRGSLFALVLLSLVTVTTVTPASAQEGEHAGAMERARHHMERGQALYLQGRFEEAAMEFEAAFDAQAFGAFLYNAGIALERAGQPTRAADFFERYLAADPGANDAAAVRARIAALHAAARPAAQGGAIAEGAPEGGATAGGATEAGATEGGTTAGGATAGGATEGGSTEGGATAGGEGGATDGGATDGGATAGGATEAGATEGGAPTPPPEGLSEEFKSLLSVRTNPVGATVTVLDGDRRVASSAAPFAHTLDQGRYRIQVSHPDFQTVEQEVRVEAGKVYVIIVEMSQGQFLGYLRVVSDVPGAAVYVDDREAGPRGHTPWEGPIPVGAHHLWIEHPQGYAPVEVDAEVELGTEHEVEVSLERVAFGRVRVTGNVRGAQVYVDGAAVGAIPWEGEVDAGARQLRVEADGMKAYEVTLEVARGRLHPVRVRLRPAPGLGSGIATTVFSALFLGGGIAVGAIGNDWMGALEQEREAGTLASDDPRLDLGLYFYIAADAAFGVSFLLGCLALYYYLHDPLPDSEGTVLEERDWAVLPMLDPVGQSVGLSLGGSF